MRKYPAISWRLLNTFDDAEHRRVPEYRLQECVVQYLQETYPNILFKGDTSTGMRASIGVAKKMKRAGNTKSWPDLFIATKRGIYAGCFLELKEYGERIYKKDRSPISEHIAAQLQMLNRLYDEGYYTSFAVGWFNAKAIIDTYLTTPSIL